MEQHSYKETTIINEQIPEPEVELIHACKKRKIALWLVLLDNIPTLILFALGIIIINFISTAGAILFGSYAVSSVILFWARICPYCHHYGTMACPCGYGAISARFFKRRETISFKRVFRKNIWIQFPNWFIPLGLAIYLLTTRYSALLLSLTVAFSLVGFVIIPAISKFVGCKNCEVKEDCPWMTMKKSKISN